MKRRELLTGTAALCAAPLPSPVRAPIAARPKTAAFKTTVVGVVEWSANGAQYVTLGWGNGGVSVWSVETPNQALARRLGLRLRKA